eukprot:TRINITY_DN28725_c0_g1_i1.p1 TRINITY_DN28725_c0_g1~~TRINITY_DN28725_c0_g1_i1.p1  ORF type:complete len:172 (+),score=34.45 TRINITY_DN28725_c0_g1_i1:131-646(+)
MIRRPPRSTQGVSSAASDVYKRQQRRVHGYLNFVGGLYGMGKEKKTRIAELIEKVGLQVEQHKRIGELSKGYRQRVGLAQALLHNPSVLILDEPTSGLDPNQIVEIRNLISSIGNEKTVLLSTHIMQEVEAICDKIVIINRGKIVAYDTTCLLYTSPSPRDLSTSRMPSSA